MTLNPEIHEIIQRAIDNGTLGHSGVDDQANPDPARTFDGWSDEAKAVAANLLRSAIKEVLTKEDLRRKV